MIDVDERHIIRVKDFMIDTLPRPRLRPKIIVNYDEWLPIITVETGI